MRNEGVILAALLALSCLACDKDQMCTAIGADPGVRFDLTPMLSAQAVNVRACVESACVHRRASVSDWRTIFVRDTSLTGPATVAVMVVIRRPGGRRP